MTERKRIILLIFAALLIGMITLGAVSLREHTYWMKYSTTEELTHMEDTEASMVQYLT